MMLSPETEEDQSPRQNGAKKAEFCCSNQARHGLMRGDRGLIDLCHLVTASQANGRHLRQDVDTSYL